MKNKLQKKTVKVLAAAFKKMAEINANLAVKKEEVEIC